MNPMKKGVCFAQPTYNRTSSNSVAGSNARPTHQYPQPTQAHQYPQPTQAHQYPQPTGPAAITPPKMTDLEWESLQNMKKVLRERMEHPDMQSLGLSDDMNKDPEVTPETSDGQPQKVSFSASDSDRSLSGGAGRSDLLNNQRSAAHPAAQRNTSLASASNSFQGVSGTKDNISPTLANSNSIRFNNHLKNYLTPQSEYLRRANKVKGAPAAASNSAEYYRNKGIFMNLEQLTKTNNLYFLQQMEFLRLNKFQDSVGGQKRVSHSSDEIHSKFKRLNQSTTNSSVAHQLARSIR